MKRFRFQLESILTLREQRERTAQRRFVEALRAYEAIEVRRREHQDLVFAWETQTRELRLQGAPACDWRALGNYGVALDEQRQRLDAEADVARRALDAAWAQMTEAARDREGLERYRNRQRAAYERAAGVADQKFLDDLAGRRRAVLQPSV